MPYRPAKIAPLFVAACFLSLSANLCWGVTIQFSSHAQVTKPFIQLGDIAKITDGAPEVIALYQQIKLAPAHQQAGNA